MSFTKSCCTVPPVVSDYVPKGNVFKLGELDIYETADKTPEKLLICVYDIFGVHPNIRQVADNMALLGYRIVIPDFFRKRKIDAVNWPPKNFRFVFMFIQRYGSWPKIVKQDVVNIIKYYKLKHKINSFGIFGFCWGGKIAMEAVTDLSEDVQAAAAVHPSVWTTEDANGIKAPILLLPSMEEDDMIPFLKIVQQNLGEDNCYHRRFDDMPHGFCGARGEFHDEITAKRITEAMEHMHSFFEKHIAVRSLPVSEEAPEEEFTLQAENFADTLGSVFSSLKTRTSN